LGYSESEFKNGYYLFCNHKDDIVKLVNVNKLK